MFVVRHATHFAIIANTKRMPHKDPEAAKAYKRAYYRDYRKGIRRTNRSELTDEEVLRRYKARVEKQMAKRRKYGAVESAEQKLIREAKSKPCIDCGVVLPYQVMHLDHVRGKKKFKLSGRGQAKLPKDRVKRQKLITEELAKCDTRCPNCHRMRHWRLGEIGNPRKRESQQDPNAPDPRKPKQEVWIKRGEALGIELLEPVVTTSQAIDVRCTTCAHEWDLKPVYLTTGVASCPECALKKRRIPQEVWDERAAKVGLVWLEPVLRARDESQARCLTCSKEFGITGATVQLERGCRDCRKERRGRGRLRQEVWDERIAKVDARWLEPVDTSRDTKKAECLKCGKVWDAWPKSISRGYGCSDCKKREKVWKPRGLAKEGLEIIRKNPGLTQTEILKLMPHVKNSGSLTYPLKRLREEGFVERQGWRYYAT